MILVKNLKFLYLHLAFFTKGLIHKKLKVKKKGSKS